MGGEEIGGGEVEESREGKLHLGCKISLKNLINNKKENSKW